MSRRFGLGGPAARGSQCPLTPVGASGPSHGGRVRARGTGGRFVVSLLAVVVLASAAEGVAPAWAQEAAAPAGTVRTSPAAPTVLHYRSINTETGNVVRARVSYAPKEEGGWLVRWSDLELPGEGEELHLDARLATVRWVVRYPSTGYEFMGERRGDTLVVEGLFAGEAVRRRLEIDDKPFHYNWKVGLVDFVRSGEEKRRFWALRPDNQTAYEFEAQRKEEASLSIDGSETRAVRIEWGLTGIRRMFYTGDHWHRVEDGYFLRGEENGVLTELVRQGERKGNGGASGGTR